MLWIYLLFFPCQIATRKWFDGIFWGCCMCLIWFFFIYLSNWTRRGEQWQAHTHGRSWQCSRSSGRTSPGTALQGPFLCVERGERVQVLCFGKIVTSCNVWHLKGFSGDSRKRSRTGDSSVSLQYKDSFCKSPIVQSTSQNSTALNTQL